MNYLKTRFFIVFLYLFHKALSQEPQRVCVIGSGPGGMYFLHALATKMKKLEEEHDISGLESLPHVTTYERASTPGGVWRNHGSGENSDEYRMMYKDLWTNGMKEIHEFSDYTYDEHYGGKLTPPYLTRKLMLDYILKRVTKKKNIFKEFDIQFDTTVTNVEYNDFYHKFNVTVIQNDEESTVQFDKVVWAGGIAGKPNIPVDLMNILTEGKFTGAIIHSTQFDNLDQSQIKGKRVIIIGDGDSSDDLAYQLIKRGVEQIFIQSRRGIGSAADTPQWPDDKVEIILKKQLRRISEDGSKLHFHPIEFDYDTQSYYFDEESEDDVTVVSDISVILLCTGYLPSIDFLAPNLRNAMMHQSDKWTAPKDWKMKLNVMTETLGDIVPDEVLNPSPYIKSKIYRNVHIDNPNMFYIYENTDQQLFDLDVHAWLVLAYILGDVEIPSKAEMIKRNQEQYLDEMDIPFLRYKLDLNYALELNKIDETGFYYDDEDEEEDEEDWYEEEDEDDDEDWYEEEEEYHWFANRTNENFRQLVWQSVEYEVRICARDMQDSGFPFSFGNYTHLNAKGKQYAQMLTELYFGKLNIKELSLSSSSRMTYRDLDTSLYISVHTGKPSIPFNGLWMDVNEFGCIANDVEDCGFPDMKSFEFRKLRDLDNIQHLNSCQVTVAWK